MIFVWAAGIGMAFFGVLFSRQMAVLLRGLYVGLFVALTSVINNEIIIVDKMFLWSQKFALVGGLIGGLIGGFGSRKVEETTRPGQRLRITLLSYIYGSVVFGVIAGLVFVGGSGLNSWQSVNLLLRLNTWGSVQGFSWDFGLEE